MMSKKTTSRMIRMMITWYCKISMMTFSTTRDENDEDNGRWWYFYECKYEIVERYV
jgi:hypothetical protein